MSVELAASSLFSVATLKVVLVVAFYYKMTSTLFRLLSWLDIVLRLPLVLIASFLATLWLVGKLF